MTSLPPTLTSSRRPKRKRQRGRSLTVRRNATNARGNHYVLHQQGDLAIDSNRWWQRLAIFGGSAWALWLSSIILGLSLATLVWLNSSDGAATTSWKSVQGHSFWSGTLSRWGLGSGIGQTAKHHYDERPLRDCLIDEDATPALYPGDLNALFEGIAANYSNHSVSNFDIIATVHTNPNHSRGNFPWILTLDNFLSEEECDVLIKLGYDQGFDRSMDVEQSTKQRDKEASHYGKITARRTSESAWCTTRSGCRDQKDPRRLHQRISDLLGIPKENSEDLQILKYNVGEFYKLHHDYIPHQRNRQCGPRILTLFMYLSDVSAGGETQFPLSAQFSDFYLTITPKKGMALLFPNIYDDDPFETDFRTRHAALPVLEGTKYAANAWIHMYNYQKAVLHGCN